MHDCFQHVQVRDVFVKNKSYAASFCLRNEFGFFYVIFFFAQ